MVSFYREKSIFSFLLLFLAIGVLFAPVIYDAPQVLVNPTDGFIWYILNGLSDMPTGFATFCFLVIKLLTALFINYIAADFKLYAKTGFIPALSFLLLSAILPGWMHLTPAFFACILLALIYYFSVRLYNATKPQAAIYNLGLITGSSILLYNPMLPAILISFYALAVTRPFKLSEWFLLLMGILTPIYFLLGYLFLSDQLELVQNWHTIFTIAPVLDKEMQTTLIGLSVAGVFIAYGFILAEQTSAQYSILSRKAKTILNICFLACTPIVFFIKSSYPHAIILLTVPGAFLLSFCFLQIKNRYVSALIFWIFVGLTIYIHWGFGKY